MWISSTGVKKEREWVSPDAEKPHLTLCQRGFSSDMCQTASYHLRATFASVCEALWLFFPPSSTADSRPSLPADPSPPASHTRGETCPEVDFSVTRNRFEPPKQSESSIMSSGESFFYESELHVCRPRQCQSGTWEILTGGNKSLY